MCHRYGKSAPMYRMSRSLLTVSATGLLCLFTGLAGAASAAPAGGVKGDPQPEMKPFKISSVHSQAPGSVAIEPNGDIVVTYDIYSGKTGKTAVCVLHRGARKCASTVNLGPLNGDDVFTVPEVFAPSANHIVVLQNTCCDTASNGDDLLYTSTDGGNTFGPPVRVGSVGVAAAALIGGNIVFSAGATGGASGAAVESIPVTATGPPSTTAIAIKKESFDNAVGSYKGGALIGSDFLGTDYTTYVAYASSGHDFNSSASYHTVGTFSHEQLIGMSGDALLTVQTTGKQALLLRLFNGSKFGAAHVVPRTKGGGPEVFAVDQDPRGTVHVFSSRAAVKTYELLEVSTSTGAHWSHPTNLGSGTPSNAFAGALDAQGTGLVLGTAPPWGHPVLAPQGVSFSLKPATITKGHTTTGTGKGSPAAKGRTVELQVKKSGLWDTVATTTEGSGGTFSFTIKGASTGTFDYRAVVADLPGYLQFGYSPAQPLKVTS
jgi:hypothetical protein